MDDRFDVHSIGIELYTYLYPLVSHAPGAVKEAATHVTGSNTEDGVARAID